MPFICNCWQEALNDLRAVTDNKAEIIMLMSVKQETTRELNEIQEMLVKLEIMLGEPKVCIIHLPRFVLWSFGTAQPFFPLPCPCVFHCWNDDSLVFLSYHHHNHHISLLLSTAEHRPPQLISNVIDPMPSPHIIHLYFLSSAPAPSIK